MSRTGGSSPLKSIDLTGQAQLFAAVKIHANVDEDLDAGLRAAGDAAGLLDVTVAVAQEIDAFLQPGAGAFGTACEQGAGEEEGRQPR